MRILLVNSHKFGGVEYYRAIEPCKVLSKQTGWEFTTIQYIHPYDDIEIRAVSEDLTEQSKKLGIDTITPDFPSINDDFLKSYDLIIFLREISCPMYEDKVFKGHHDAFEIKKRLDRLGIPFGMDIDDFWELPDNHLIANEYKQLGRTELIIKSLKAAKFVTCTTSILAYEIMKYNPNVYVLENGLDLEHEAWQVEGTKSDILRFGFMLGSTHFHDLKKAAPSVNNLFRSSLKGYQVALAGFSAEQGKPSIYIGMEKILTDNHNLIDKSYRNYLALCTEHRNNEFNKMPYVRLWGKPVEEFGHVYKDIDVSVVPLVNNQFNNCKSELKVIEAAFKGKCVIASNVAPYTICLNEKNSYLVNSSCEFYDKMKRALQNPQEVVDKILQLREDILPKYNLQLLSKKRKEVYELNK